MVATLLVPDPDAEYKFLKLEVLYICLEISQVPEDLMDLAEDHETLEAKEVQEFPRGHQDIRISQICMLL